MSRRGPQNQRAGSGKSSRRASTLSPIRGEDGRIVRALKQDADTVIAERQRQLAQLDVGAMADDWRQVIASDASTFAARIQTKRVVKNNRVRIDILSRDEVASQLATYIDQLLRFGSGNLKQQLDDEFFRLDVGIGGSVSRFTQHLVALSDILRAILEPWDHEIFRRFGVVGLPSGYPATLPRLRSTEMLGHLVDEREYLPITKQMYTVPNIDGDPVDLVGPASGADGTVDARDFRAFKSMGLATLNKLRESIRPAKRKRKRSRKLDASSKGKNKLPKSARRPVKRKLSRPVDPAWPWPTRLAGLRNGQIFIAEYLAADRFGIVRDSEADLLMVPQSPSTNYPPLPAGRRRIK